jgi:Trk K+ transport system NAD-binding subunit
MVASVAHRLKISSIFAIVNNEEHTDLFQNQGIKTIEKPTEMIIAQYIYNAIKQPQLENLVILPQGGQVFYLTVSANSLLVGETLATIKKKKIILSEMTIIAIKHEGKREITEDNTVIVEGDGVTLFSLEKIRDDLIKKLTGQDQ